MLFNDISMIYVASLCHYYKYRIISKNHHPLNSMDSSQARRANSPGSFVHTYNKFYEPNSGLSMGPPLSSPLADIFISYLIEPILSSQVNKKHIFFWYRYVNDILPYFIGTKSYLNI